LGIFGDFGDFNSSLKGLKRAGIPGEINDWDFRNIIPGILK
jgi:hypothetical protein